MLRYSFIHRWLNKKKKQTDKCTHTATTASTRAASTFIFNLAICCFFYYYYFANFFFALAVLLLKCCCRCYNCFDFTCIIMFDEMMRTVSDGARANDNTENSKSRVFFIIVLFGYHCSIVTCTVHRHECVCVLAVCALLFCSFFIVLNFVQAHAKLSTHHFPARALAHCTYAASTTATNETLRMSNGDALKLNSFIRHRNKNKITVYKNVRENEHICHSICLLRL